MLPFLRVAAEEAAKTASVDAEKAKLANAQEHSALFLLPAPTQTSISVERFHNVGSWPLLVTWKLHATTCNAFLCSLGKLPQRSS